MARIIEAKAVISGEDRTGAMFDSLARKMKAVGKGAKASVEVDRLNKAMDGAARGLRAIERVNTAQRSFAESQAAYRVAQNNVAKITGQLEAARKAASAFDGVKAFSKTSGIGREIAAARAQVADLEKAFASAQRSVHSVSRAYQTQSTALMAARQSAERSGVSVGKLVSEQNRLKAAVDGANAALQRQAARQERQAARRGAAGTIAAGAGVVAAHKGKTMGLEAVQSAADFDLAVRKQKVFTDIGADDQAGLLSQAKRIGQETQFSNIDVVKAQTAAMQGLPAGFGPSLKAQVAEGIVENVRNYSTLMETDLKEGAEIIRSYLQATGKDISTKEKALSEANKATNQIVKMAKLGGMNGEDAAQFVKYAAASSTSAGISTDTMLTLGALARRGGLRGDEAGVAARSMAGKLVSPTDKGLAALNAAGIKFDDYVSMPKQLSTSALEGQFGLKMGKGFTPEIRTKLDTINADKALISDRAAYTKAVTDAVAPILGKKKDGTVRASDARTAAKTIGGFHKVSAQSVDVERLLDDAMSKNMTLQQLNAWLTDKHGGKGAITQGQWDEFKAARAEIKKTGDDPDFTKKKADEVFAGLGGAVENLKGSWENLILSLGTANESLIRFTADGLGKGIDAFSNLNQGTQQLLSVLGFGAAAGGGVLGAMKLAGALFGPGGGAVALTGSATALTTSAGLLDAAAIKLAGGSVVGSASTAAGTASGAAGAAGAAGLAGIGLGGIGIGLVGGAGLAGYATAKMMPEMMRTHGPAGMDPATGGASDTNPMAGMAPETPVLLDWWRSHAPTWAGGDAGSQSEALAKALEAAKATPESARDGVTPPPTPSTASLPTTSLPQAVVPAAPLLRDPSPGLAPARAGDAGGQAGVLARALAAAKAAVAPVPSTPIQRDPPPSPAPVGAGDAGGQAEVLAKALAAAKAAAAPAPSAPIQRDPPPSPAPVGAGDAGGQSEALVKAIATAAAAAAKGLDRPRAGLAPAGVSAEAKPTPPPAPKSSGLGDWWRGHAPTWAGGDAGGQGKAIGNTLDKAAGASAAAANGGKPVEATVRPDQITAQVKELPAITGEAKVDVENRINVAVTLNEPMLQAKIDSAAGKAVAKIPLSSSGGRSGAVSMPGAASTPGAK